MAGNAVFGSGCDMREYRPNFGYLSGETIARLSDHPGRPGDSADKAPALASMKKPMRGVVLDIEPATPPSSPKQAVVQAEPQKKVKREPSCSSPHASSSSASSASWFGSIVGSFNAATKNLAQSLRGQFILVDSPIHGPQESSLS